jgi:hypothetical protein
MRTLPLHASDQEIKALVCEWSKLLAAKRYQDALDLFPHSDLELSWTSETLQQVIAGYGVLDEDSEALESLLARHEVPCFEITTLMGRPDRDEIIDKIDVNRKSLCGLDPKHYLGVVHYEDVSLSGFRSDLTAQFHIKRVGAAQLTLEFLNLHVM